MLEEILNQSGASIKHCYQCGGCTGICPISEIDPSYNPRKILQFAALEISDKVLPSSAIWKCASCYFCNENCPQNVRVKDIIDSIRGIAEEEANQGKMKLTDARALYESEVLKSIAKYGRFNEVEVISKFTLRTTGVKDLLSYATAGMDMLRKRKIAITPEKLSSKGLEEIRRIFELAGL